MVNRNRIDLMLRNHIHMSDQLHWLKWMPQKKSKLLIKEKTVAVCFTVSVHMSSWPWTDLTTTSGTNSASLSSSPCASGSEVYRDTGHKVLELKESDSDLWFLVVGFCASAHWRLFKIRFLAVSITKSSVLFISLCYTFYTVTLRIILYAADT